MAKKPVAVPVENGRSMGMNLSQLNEKGNGREKKKKKKEEKGGVKLKCYFKPMNNPLQEKIVEPEN